MINILFNNYYIINIKKYKMNKYGYAIYNDFICHIEILDDYNPPCFEPGFMDESNKKNAIYSSRIFKIINIYDEYNNMINNDMINNVYKDEIDFAENKNVIMEKYKLEKYFYEYYPKDYIEHHEKYETFENMTLEGAKKYLYNKKNIKNNHIGIQKIYTNEGYLSAEFFHTNGIKNGKYIIYDFYNHDNIENKIKCIVEFGEDIPIKIYNL